MVCMLPLRLHQARQTIAAILKDRLFEVLG
jgi:hypothetical protein